MTTKQWWAMILSPLKKIKRSGSCCMWIIFIVVICLTVEIVRGLVFGWPAGVTFIIGCLLLLPGFWVEPDISSPI